MKPVLLIAAGWYHLDEPPIWTKPFTHDDPLFHDKRGIHETGRKALNTYNGAEEDWLKIQVFRVPEDPIVTVTKHEWKDPE